MTDFVISEERLKRMLSHPSFTIYEDVKKRPLSDELKKERERVLDELIEEYDKLAMEGWNAWKLEGWNAWKFKEIMKSMREHP